VLFLFAILDVAQLPKKAMVTTAKNIFLIILKL
jgi:hypothetical protein